MPLLLLRFKQVGSYFPHAALERTDLQWLIASGRAALQLPKDVAAAPFGIGHQPGEDLLPLPRKGILVGAPPAQHMFSLLLLSVQVRQDLLSDREDSSRQDSLPVVQCSTEKTRIGNEEDG